MSGFTIGKLARSAGVPTSTLRFYELAGLLTPDARSGGNYRQYGDDSLSRLRFIRSAQATGLSLEDIRELLALIHSEATPCHEVVALLKHRLAEVRGRIKQLRQVEKVLADAVANSCKGDGAEDICEEIKRLRSRRGMATCR